MYKCIKQLRVHNAHLNLLIPPMASQLYCYITMRTSIAYLNIERYCSQPIQVGSESRAIKNPLNNCKEKEKSSHMITCCIWEKNENFPTSH